MMGKLLAIVISALVFINAIASNAAVFFTELSATWPGLARYAAISLAISAFLAPFLPRIQKLRETFRDLLSGDWE